jgi:hypothetical protein
MDEFIRYKDSIRKEITKLNQDVGGLKYSLDNNSKLIENSIKLFENNFKAIENSFKVLNDLLAKEFKVIHDKFTGDQP